MAEAVRWEYFQAFFSGCSRLPEPHGLMSLQAICVDDRLYGAEKANI